MKSFNEKIMYKLFILILGMLSSASAQQAILFQDVGDVTSTTTLRNIHGSGMFDYDGDGFVDIFVVHNLSVSSIGEQPHVLFKNNGDGTFIDNTIFAGVQGYNTSAQGMAAADYDNDGDLDLLIAMGIWSPLLYVNNGDGTFDDGTSFCGLGNIDRGRVLAFFDYNNDGHVDLLADSDALTYLYRNNGDGSFEEVSVQANVRFDRDSDTSLSYADFDNDGDIDIYFPSMGSANPVILINNNDGTFHEDNNIGIPNDPFYSGAIFLDYNNDGLMDLFARGASGYPSKLCENNGNGTFSDVSLAVGLNVYIQESPYGMGLSIGDFNNDGFIDIFALAKNGRNMMFMNRNGESFIDVASDANLYYNSRFYWSAPVGDYNNDGYLDIFFARGDGGAMLTTLMKNMSGDNHWLHVKLEGVASNRSGIGAQVKIYADGKQQMRMVRGGDGYKMDTLPVEFGLGTSVEVDSMFIHWPNGTLQRVNCIPADTLITVVESSGTTVISGSPPLSISDLIVERNNDLLKLSWSPVLLDEDGGASSIASYAIISSSDVTFPEIATDTIRWIGEASYSDDFDDCLSSPEKNIYFKCYAKGVNGLDSQGSNIVGKFQYALETTASTDFNEICTALIIPGIVNAEDLLNTIPGCNSIAMWEAATQLYVQYVPGLSFTNFPVEPGHPYYANVTTGGLFTQLGAPAVPVFDLITTTTTDFNGIMLPLDKTDIATASELMADIPACNSVAIWNVAEQGYEQYVPGLSFTDFDVEPGYPYYVNMTAGAIWPGSGTPKRTVAESYVAKNRAGSSVPHLVWGKFSNVANMEKFSGITVTAFIKSRPAEILSGNLNSTDIDENYWTVQCGSFISAWRAGDILCVELNALDGEIKENIEVILTNEPADNAEEIQFEFSDKSILFQNYPNPFRQETVIEYLLLEATHVQLEVYNIGGQRVRSLASSQKDAGSYKINWDGRNDSDNIVASGVYLLILKTDDSVKKLRTVFLR